MTLQHRPGHVEDVREADATGSASSTAEHSAKRSAALLKIQNNVFNNTLSLHRFRLRLRPGRHCCTATWATP